MSIIRAVGGFLFRWRGVMPLPWIALYMWFAEPRLYSLIIGFIVFAFGECLRLWAVSHIGSPSRAEVMGAESMIIDGPYAIVRHPLYSGNILIAMGEIFASFALFPYQFLLIIIFPVIYYILIAKAEEDYLRGRFDSYGRHFDNKPLFYSIRLLTDFGRGGITMNALVVEMVSLVSHILIWGIILSIFISGINLSDLIQLFI
ncbi:MAG: hypothetical protein B6D57_01095 [Candidatus Coatesbacteria bacterium 4484_99]|uniref:Steroid 5-alpha reductase C-terminal domain-containing protein n=1 Tax=Candidatus Coatesbacteria bacterium 4484_99 TaxID=1970774 RepID=A0A1W9S2M2_9BACT|nr:MAG: hypothetical protein B6D57_01095 [Candidatus Coatesbacteria bacterium 4484_99]RLC42831.1 MAG: isoprenylcysteine carboxylmethyltransferase family protein [Candidatus Coatesbacteria bacterium]HEC80014.1 isoprenylcysteine carboxylmethyltransferase family protein [Bacillota bacterium]